MSPEQDDPAIRARYRPFLLSDAVAASDWISRLELDRVIRLSLQDIEQTGQRLRILVLYGSLRTRSVNY